MQVSGWLLKAPIKTGLFGGSTWERKFVWINGDSMFVAPKEPRDYTNPEITRDTLIIKFEDGKVFITKETSQQMQKLKAPSTLVNYGFRISPATGNSHLFACSSDEERTSWLISGEQLIKSIKKSRRNFMEGPATASRNFNALMDDDDDDDDFVDDFEDALEDDDDDKAAAFASRSSSKIEGKKLQASDLDLETRVKNFYIMYNPQKVADVPGILQGYKGKEKLLIEKLKEKYGQEPTPQQVAEKSQRCRLMDLSSI